ncbi:MAG: S9 family peptidase [Acidimicrobiia bacterium]
MRLTPETLWRLGRVGAPAVVGGTVVVPVTNHDLDENRSVTRLYRLGDDGLEPLTTGEGTAPAVSPDGRRVAFLRTVDARPQVHVMPLDGGEPRRLTDLPLGAGSPHWLPDGSGLLCHGLLRDAAPTIDGTRELAAELAERRVTARTTEERIYRFWDRWLTDGDRHHLFRIDLGGDDPVDLTPGRGLIWALPGTGDPIDDVSISPDGSHVVFAAAEAGLEERDRWRLWRVPIGGGDRELVAEHPTGDLSRPRHLADGSIVFGETRELDFYATPVIPSIIDVDGTTHALVEDWELSPGAWEPEPTTGRVLLTAEERGRVSLFALDPTGGRPERLAADHTLTHPRPDGRGLVYLLRQSLSSPPEIVSVAATGGDPTPVARVDTELLADLELGEVEERWVSGARGDEIQVFVVHPPEAPDGPAPLVHLVHGGPHSTFGDMWHWRWNAHAFAAPGRVVALVNFHGSTSFGHEFTRSIQGDWGTMPTTDVLAATDALVADGLVDEGRMALAGGSYGGYLVAWMGGHTDRFAAIVAHAAVTNQGGMWATDATHGLARARGAAVWEDPDRVAATSPSQFYRDYRTPTLVVHGERDYRVPVTQGLELYGVLTDKGVPARLVYYPDEAHWVLSPANSIHWYGEVSDWLDRWLA